MKPGALILFLLTFTLSCSESSDFSALYKKGLISFEVEESIIRQKSREKEPFLPGELWQSSNKINLLSEDDTLIVEVNKFIDAKLNYQGGYKMKDDTLLLFSRRINSKIVTDSILGTLRYRILNRGYRLADIQYQEID